MAGHSHWANIKRKKGANDAKRGKVWSKIARKIIIAAKGGGGDPGQNLSLRYVIDEAKEANMPRDTIKNAILKGTGELGGDNYETAQYEGYGAGGVAVIVEALTNNRTRTAPEIRKIFEINGGNMGTPGSVGFQFTRQGILSVKATVDEESLMNTALEAGAEDVRQEGESFIVVTTPMTFHKVKDALKAAGVEVEASEVAFFPNNTVDVPAENVARILKMVSELEDNDDVQAVSHNGEFPEDVA